MEECGQTKVTKAKGAGLSKSIQSHKDYLTSGLGLSGLFKKSLRVTQMLPAINLEQ
jgi:hypothetical protein